MFLAFWHPQWWKLIESFAILVKNPALWRACVCSTWCFVLVPWGVSKLWLWQVRHQGAVVIQNMPRTCDDAGQLWPYFCKASAMRVYVLQKEMLGTKRQNMYLQKVDLIRICQVGSSGSVLNLPVLSSWLPPAAILQAGGTSLETACQATSWQLGIAKTNENII